MESIDIESLKYYLLLLLFVVAAVVVVKRVASCLVRSIVTLVLLTALAYVYFIYIKV